MNKYMFSGKILPERAPIDIVLNGIKMDAIDAGISGTVNVSIIASQVSVIINTNSDSDIGTLKNYVEYLVKSLVDAIGYLYGRGYDGKGLVLRHLLSHLDQQPFDTHHGGG